MARAEERTGGRLALLHVLNPLSYAQRPSLWHHCRLDATVSFRSSGGYV